MTCHEPVALPTETVAALLLLYRRGRRGRPFVRVSERLLPLPDTHSLGLTW